MSTDPRGASDPLDASTDPLDVIPPSLPIGKDALPILEADPNPVVGVALDGTIQYANPQAEAAFGWTRDELIGRPVETLVPQALAAAHVAHRTAFVDTPAARPMGIGLDLAARRRNGSEFPVEISLVPLDTPGGTLILATVVDITARRALESQLFEARKMESIGRLSGGIAHDFNNILTAIIGFADLALSAPPGADLTGDLTTIREAAQRAAGLTHQLLAFGRRQVLRPQFVDPNDIINATEPMLRRLIGERIDLIVSMAPQSGTIQVDPTQLGQVIMNLALNGRDAMPDGGRLIIRSERAHFDETDLSRHADIPPGDYLVISVGDTGVGMDAATRAHIFEPFFTTKEVGKGTGLGLATTYGIVKQSGGHIWVYSEEGKGTTFRIYFPEVERDEAENRDSGPTRAGATQSHQILFVEDEPMLRELTRRVLVNAGFNVLEAANAGEALELADRPEVDLDLLLSDVVMPGLSGVALADALRRRLPHLRVLLMSGYAEEIVLAEQSSYAFVAKPFTPQVLLDAILDALVEPVSYGRGS
jgi:two-component system, cell cycle sensor histidine kinase and response regulator CckA